jgi:ABC-type uncharacterized transport system permease subunit
VFVIGILGIFFPPYLTYYFGISEVVVGFLLMISAVRICKHNKRDLHRVLVEGVGLAKIAGVVSVLLLICCSVTVTVDAIYLAACSQQFPKGYDCPEQWASHKPINSAHAIFRVTSQGIAFLMSCVMAITFFLQMHLLDKRHQLIPYIVPF